MARYPSKKRDPKKVAKKAAAKKGKAPAKKAGKGKKVVPKPSRAQAERIVAKQAATVDAAVARGHGLSAKIRENQVLLDDFNARLSSAPPPKPPSRWYRFRCAITGLFTGRKHAEANPATTVRERMR